MKLSRTVLAPAGVGLFLTSVLVTLATSGVPFTGQTMNDGPAAGYEDEVRVNDQQSTSSSRTPPSHNWFNDIDTESDFGWAASTLADKGIIGGYPDGSFRSWQPVNRAEAAKFLLRARYGDILEIGNDHKFWDVRDGEWYVRYVVTAAQRGIIGGYPDGSFGPAKTVKTGEFLKMLTLTFALEQNLPYQFPDVAGDAWFAPYAGVAEHYKLFSDRGGYLDPGRELTRGEVAFAIARILEEKGSQNHSVAKSASSYSVYVDDECSLRPDHCRPSSSSRSTSSQPAVHSAPGDDESLGDDLPICEDPWTELFTSANRGNSLVKDNASTIFNGKIWNFSEGTVYSSDDGRSWDKIGEVPRKTSGRSAFSFNGKLWFIPGAGYGEGKAKVFSSTNGHSWELMSTLPLTGAQAVPFRSGILLVAEGEAKQVKGGWTSIPSSKIYFSEDGRTWNVIGELPALREDFAILSYKNRVWIFGGGPKQPNSSIAPTATVFSSEDGIAWHQENDMPVPMMNGAAIVYHGKFVVFGNKHVYSAEPQTGHLSWNEIQGARLPYEKSNAWKSVNVIKTPNDIILSTPPLQYGRKVFAYNCNGKPEYDPANHEDSQITITQQDIGETAEANPGDTVTLMRFEIRGDDHHDVTVSDISFNGEDSIRAGNYERSRSIRNVADWTLWIDTDGNGDVDTVDRDRFDEYVEYLRFGSNGILIPKGETFAFEVRGKIAEWDAHYRAVFGNTVQIGFDSTELYGPYISAMDKSYGDELTGISTNGNCPQDSCAIFVETRPSIEYTINDRSDQE